MRKAAAQALRRRDPAAARLVDAARALGEEGDLWLTCTALRESLPGVAGRGLRSTLEKQRRALCRLHDGELVAIRRQLLAKRPRPRKPSHPVASGDLRDDLP